MQAQAAQLSKGINAINMSEATHAAKALQAAAVGSQAFTAKILPATTAVDSFNQHLMKNKFSMGDYAKYSMAASKSVGYLSQRMSGFNILSERSNMINQVAGQRVRALATQYVQLGASVTGAQQVMALTPAILNKNIASQQMALEKQRLMNMLIADGSTKMLNWGKNMQWAGRQLMVGFTLPLTLFAGIAISVFNDMEKQALEFKKVYGDLFTTEPEMQQNLQAVKDLGLEFTKYGIAIKDTMKMATTAAAAGQQNADLIAATTEATRLQVLGQMEGQDAMATTISLQTAFKMSNEQLTESINFLNAVENQTVLTLQDVTEAIPRVATVINSFGGGVEELSVLLVAMKEGGVSAAEGANALKNSLARLITPTKAAREMTSAFGIDLEAIVKNNRGQLIPMLTELGDELNKLGGTQKQEVLSTLFGKYQYARIGTMLQSLTANASQASRAIDLTSATAVDLAKTAERELGRVEDSTSTKAKATMEKLKAGLVPIGEEFLKAAMPILEFLGELIKKFNDFPDTVKQAFVSISTVVGIIAPVVLMMTGLFANLIAQGIKGVQLLRRVSQTILGQGKAWSRLSLEELEAANMANSLNAATEKTTSALLVQGKTIGMLNTELRSYVSLLAEAVALNSAFAGKGMPGVVGRGRAVSAAKIPKPATFNDGGNVFDSRSNHYVPGVGNTDTVPAILTPGEFVVNKQATKENLPILHAINNGEAVQRNKGGMIPGMQYFATPRRQRVVENAPEIRTPKPPKSISLNPTEQIPANSPREYRNQIFKSNLNTEITRLNSLLKSVWENRSRRDARTTLNPQGLLRPPLGGRKPTVQLHHKDDMGLTPAWTYQQRDINKNRALKGRVFVSTPNTFASKEASLYDNEMSGLLNHELFHASKPTAKYGSPREMGREEARAMIAQSIAQGRITHSYERLSDRLDRRNWTDPSTAPRLSQEFNEEILKHVTRVHRTRGDDIAGLKEFYGTGIGSSRSQQSQAFNEHGYSEVRRDAALSKIFDSFIPISKTSNPRLYREMTRAAKRRGIPKELFVHQVGNREMIQTSALLMNARAQGSKPFNDIFMKLLDSGLRRKTTGLEKFFGGRGSQTRQDPMDRNVINQLVDDVTNPSFQSIRDNNLFSQRFNKGGMIRGYFNGGRVKTQAKKGLAKYNQERTVSGQGILASARAGLNETQSRYGVFHRNYDVNPATEFLRNMGVLKPGALKQDIWNRVRNVRQFGLNHPELVSAPNEIFMKRDLRTETRRRVPQTTDPDYQPSYDKTLQRLIHRDDSTISMYSPIRINTASTKRGQARSGFDTEISDAGYSRSASSLTWARGKLKKEEMPGIYMDPKAREGDLLKQGLLEHEYSHQSRGVQARRLSSPIEEARAMTTEISVTGKQIDRHYLESQQKRLEGKGVIQNADERQKKIEQIFEEIGQGRYSPKWIESHIDEIKRLQNNIAPFSALLPPSALGKTPHLASGVESRADQLRFMLTQLEKLPRINPSKNPQSKKLIEDIFGTHNWRPYSATEVFAAGMINPMFAKSTPELSQSFLLSLMKEASSTPMSSSTLNLAAKKAMTKNFNTGDRVPGIGNTDTVPAMLTPGEFVVNKQATQSNLSLLHAINDGKAPSGIQGFNKGGPIPGVQYFATENDERVVQKKSQSRATRLELLHLYEPEVADKQLTERLKADSKNKRMQASSRENFNLYSNLGIIGPGKMQHGATGTSMAKLFTPQLMDRTMAPFYQGYAHAMGQNVETVMRNTQVRAAVHNLGNQLGTALTTHASQAVTPQVFKSVLSQASVVNDPILGKALATMQTPTTAGYNRPGGTAERGSISHPMQASMGVNRPVTSYRSWWSGRRADYLDRIGYPADAAQARTEEQKKNSKFGGKKKGKSQAAPAAAVEPAKPLGAMPPPLNIVPTVSRKDIARQTRLTAQSNVISRLDAESRSTMSQVRPVPIGPLLPADQRAFEQLRKEIFRNLLAQKGSSLLAEEQQRVGKEAMKLQRQQNKRDAKKLAQTKTIGDNNAKLIAQQRDAIMAANPALTRRQATEQARGLVMPQPQMIPQTQTAPRISPPSDRASANEKIQRVAQSSMPVINAQSRLSELKNIVSSRGLPGIAASLQVPAAEQAVRAAMAQQSAIIGPAIMARAKAESAARADGTSLKNIGKQNSRFIAQETERILSEKGIARGAATPEQYRSAREAAKQAAMPTTAAVSPTTRPSILQRYKDSWQNRAPSFLRSGAVPVLNEDGTARLNPDGSPVTQRQASKLKRGAGKAAGGIGAAGMMLSMMPMFMQDDKGKFLGVDPMAAMGGIMGASMAASGIKAMIGSTALGGIVSTAGTALGVFAVAAVAAGVALKLWRDSVNNSAKASAELGANLGGTANAVNKMAQVIGVDTPAQRQAKLQMGFTKDEQKLANDRFGQMLSSDQGKAFVNELKKSNTAQRVTKVKDYVQASIATNQLSVEDARLFTKTLATALGDPILGTAVTGSITSAMASPDAMKKMADKRLAAVTTAVPPNIETAIDVIKNAPSLSAEVARGDNGYQKSIATDVSAFAIGSAVQVIQDYSNVIALTREQYQQGIITFEKYNSTITRATAIQNEYANVLSKAVGGAVDVQGARQALDTQLVAGGIMNQEQVDALTHATDIGVQGGDLMSRLSGLGIGQGTAGVGPLGFMARSLTAYESDYVARGAQKMGISDSQLTDDQRMKLIDEASKAQDAATQMFERGLNEDLKSLVISGKATGDAAAALGLQLMNNSKSAGAIQYQAMQEQGKGLLGLEQAGFIDTANALKVEGLGGKGQLQKYIDVGIKFSTSGGSLEEYRAFINSLPEGRRQVYIDILANTSYEGETAILSGATSIAGLYGDEAAARIVGSKAYVDVARATASSGPTTSTAYQPTQTAGMTPEQIQIAEKARAAASGGERGDLNPTAGMTPRQVENMATNEVLANKEKDKRTIEDQRKVDAAIQTVGEKVGTDVGEQVYFAATVRFTKNGKVATGEELATETLKLGAAADFIQKTIPEDVLRELQIDFTDPADIDRWGNSARAFQDNWLTISQLDPNVNLSSVFEFLTVDAEGNELTPEQISENTLRINDAMSDLKNSKDLNVRKQAYVTLALAEIKDASGNPFDEEAVNSALTSIVDKFGAKVLQLPPYILNQSIEYKADASAMRDEANRIRKTDPGLARLIDDQAAALDTKADAGVSTGIKNLDNTKDGGGGGGKKKETPIKDMNKGFLDQIKMYTNMDANLKKLNAARGKFAESLLKGKGIIQKLREAGVSEGIISSLAAKGFSALQKGYKQFVSKGKVNALGKNENFLARSSAITAATGGIEQAIVNAQNQTTAARRMKNMRGTSKKAKGLSLTSEELTTALSDPELQDAFAKIDTKKGRNEIQKYINKVLELRKINKDAARELDPRQSLLDDMGIQAEYLNAEIASTEALLTKASGDKFAAEYGMTKDQAELQMAINQQQIDAIQREIDKKQESNNLDQHSIDLLEHGKKQWQDKIDLIQESIDGYQKSIDTYQRENEMRNQQTSIINHSLDIMSQKEDDITTAYNKRVDALDQVAKINDYLINQQKSQLSLADALSRGDIGAAAGIQQDMRATDAQFATEEMRTGLQTGMENQIAGLTTEGGLTRLQAEAELNRLKELSYQNDLLITSAQNEIYNKTQAMLPYKTELEKIDKNIATYTETIWQRNNDIYNIENSKLKSLQDNNKELDTRLKMSDDQLKIDIMRDTLSYQTQLDSLDIGAKQIELSMAQEAAVGLIGKRWENVLDLIIAANKALKEGETEESKLRALAATNPKDAAALIKKADDLAKGTKKTYEDTIKKIGEMKPVLSSAAPVAPEKKAAGGIIGTGGRDSIPAMLTPGEFIMRKASVQKYGTSMLSRMNIGSFEMPRYDVSGRSMSQPTNAVSTSTNINAPVYNTYSVNVNVPNTNADPSMIADKVIMRMSQIDNANIRSVRGNK